MFLTKDQKELIAEIHHDVKSGINFRVMSKQFFSKFEEIKQILTLADDKYVDMYLFGYQGFFQYLKGINQVH